MGLGGVAIAALPSMIHPKLSFSDSLGGGKKQASSGKGVQAIILLDCPVISCNLAYFIIHSTYPHTYPHTLLRCLSVCYGKK